MEAPEKMRTRLTPKIVPDPASHPAARAWMEFASWSRVLERIEAIKRPSKNGKSAVFRLVAVGPSGADVIAKESSIEDTKVERTLYCDVLPNLSIDGPRFIGWVPSTDVSRSWLFLEAVNGPRFDRTNERHSQLAAQWLAIIHAETAGRSIDADLPSRGPGFYQTLVHETAADLLDVLPNPVLSPPDLALLRRISAQLETLDGSWDRIDEIYSKLPVGLMHGDFVAKNLAFDATEGPPELRVFDWAEAHWGPMAVDLHAIDTVAYRRALREHGQSDTPRWLNRAKHLGLVLRLISSVAWEVPHLRYGWTVRSMRKMVLYERGLNAAIASSDWIERIDA